MCDEFQQIVCCLMTVSLGLFLLLVSQRMISITSKWKGMARPSLSSSVESTMPGISRQVLLVSMEPKYQCQQCKDILRKPFQAQCGHRFCVFCFKLLTRYPRFSCTPASPPLSNRLAQTHPAPSLLTQTHPVLLILLLQLPAYALSLVSSVVLSPRCGWSFCCSECNRTKQKHFV